MITGHQFSTISSTRKSDHVREDQKLIVIYYASIHDVDKILSLTENFALRAQMHAVFFITFTTPHFGAYSKPIGRVRSPFRIATNPTRP